MTSLVRAGFVCEVYANWSRWVAHCGRCPRAVRLQPRTAHFECDFCGAVTETIWPTDEIIRGVERLLMMRPDPSKRNWVPGETLHDLMFENAAHGIFDNLDRLGLGAETGTALLSVDDESIRVDRLPALKHRVRREIS